MLLQYRQSLPQLLLLSWQAHRQPAWPQGHCGSTRHGLLQRLRGGCIWACPGELLMGTPAAASAFVKSSPARTVHSC